MEEPEPSQAEAADSLHAKFYRFLDATGAILSPPNPQDVGELGAEVKAQLALKKLPEMQQIGYVSETADASDEAVDEVMVVPIFSTETGDVISALVVGFKPFEVISKSAGPGLKSGIWMKGRLHLPSVPKSAQSAIGDQIANAVSKSDSVQNNINVTINGAPQLLFYKLLNPESVFPSAYEICVYPLAESVAQQRRLRWQIGGAGALLLLRSSLASNFMALRLSLPVGTLAVCSEHNHAARASTRATPKQ